MADKTKYKVQVRNVSKTFVMHLRGGAELPVVQDVTFEVAAGTCAVLGGPSGVGKSSLLKMMFGNYRTDSGQILLHHGGDWIDIAAAAPRKVLEVRKTTLGYVSQFLRCIPRVSARSIVATAVREADSHCSRREAEDVAQDLLSRLNLPERLWGLPPATFSGGEQQRINIACGFAAKRPILLLDEPTASLDAANRAVVIDLIEAQKRDGAAIVGIFHDDDVRKRVADTVIDVTQFAAAPA